MDEKRSKNGLIRSENAIFNAIFFSKNCFSHADQYLKIPKK